MLPKTLTNKEDIEDVLPEGKTAALCIPVDVRGGMCAYILLCSDSAFHIISQETASEFKLLLKPLSMSIYMYLTKITSMTDKLTGALNRKYFEIAFEKSIQKAVKTDSQLSIIMTDLDNFKSINDTFGHQTGDAVLKNLGAVIRKNLRKDTIFGRFGGEEFIIVLEETNVDDAFKISEKLRIAVDDAKLLGIKRPVTASFGIATLPRHGISKAVLIDRADMALYRSKKAGRNISTIYDESQHSKEIAADTTDIISGDTIIDVMRMRMTFEIMNIAKEATTHAQKNSAILGRIKQMAQADDIFYLPILEVGSSDNIAKASVHEKRPKLQIEIVNGKSKTSAAIPCIYDDVVEGVLCISVFSDCDTRRLWNDELLLNFGNLTHFLELGNR